MSEHPGTSDGIAAQGRRSRRSWSRAEKQRIIEEAFRPGASTADIARSYGLNANQVFNWRRRAVAATEAQPKGSSSRPLVLRDRAQSMPDAPIFLPIGTIPEPTDAEAPAPPGTVREIGRTVSGSRTAAGPATDGQPGLIEIDLPCGARLRVDAFVNERALRRVLSVLKASG